MSDREDAGRAGPGDAAWERELLKDLAWASLKEQRRARRWGLLMRFLFLGYLVALLWVFTADQSEVTLHAPGDEFAAVVDLQGIISEETEASAELVIAALRDAFEAKGSKGVILRANSPGGSPVQSDYVFNEIRRLREEHPDTPLYAVVTDLCASGCYYIAAAADEIYANPSSIVGSIGVINAGFGFDQAIRKLGLERRLFTAGEHKGFLDPFSPLKEAEVTHLRQILEEIHERFIAAVREGRGDRLKEDPQLFSGLVWTGERGLELGLVDGFASVREVAREKLGVEETRNFTHEEDVWQRIADRLGVAIGKGVGRVLQGGVAPQAVSR